MGKSVAVLIVGLFLAVSGLVANVGTSWTKLKRDT